MPAKSTVTKKDLSRLVKIVHEVAKEGGKWADAIKRAREEIPTMAHRTDVAIRLMYEKGAKKLGKTTSPFRTFRNQRRGQDGPQLLLQAVDRVRHHVERGPVRNRWQMVKQMLGKHPYFADRSLTQIATEYREIAKKLGLTTSPFKNTTPKQQRRVRCIRMAQAAKAARTNGDVLAEALDKMAIGLGQIAQDLSRAASQLRKK